MIEKRSGSLNPRFVIVALIAALPLVAWHGTSVPGANAAPIQDAYSTHAMIPSAYLTGGTVSNVIELAMIPGRPNEAIIAQQSGYIYRVALDGSFGPVLWGDVHTLLNFDNGEQGLLSVAFAPDFLTSSRVYLYYTPGSPTPTRLARFTATATDLNESSVEPLLDIEEFAGNHNGGHIAFDSDEYLYLSLGDGGGGGDPQEKGQSLTTLLGKVLRIDVSGATGYTNPGDNPFNDGPSNPIREEIFAYGFRNPWRMTIDPLTDDVWLGDVGQNNWEEVDRVVKGGNYGWNCYEGNHSYEADGCLAPDQYLYPRAEYDHSFGAAVTGGVVYRGTDMPELYGWYVYSDFYTGIIWAVNPADASLPVRLIDTPLNVASFTLMPDGEIAIVTYSSGIHRLTGADADGDGVVASSDNCPDWPNAGQALPTWPLPNDDFDCDGWTTNIEDYAGTDAARHCAGTSPQNDEPTPDAWPVDFNDNRVVNGQDVGRFAAAYGQSVLAGPFGTPPLPGQRFDFNGNGVINGQDIGRFSVFYATTCA